MGKANRNLSVGVFIVLLAFAVTGCSSSKRSSDDDDDQASADAGTDAVPAASAEADSSAPDQTMASADTSADAKDTGATPGRISSDASDPSSPAAQAPANASETASAPPVEATAPVVAEQASSGSGETYTVQGGDTLMRIAFEHYGDLYKWKEIYENNRDKIKNPNVIYPGIVLNLSSGSSLASVPTGEKYKVKSGDTLGTIAKTVYGTSNKWKELWKFNESIVPDPNKIFAGFFVYYSKAVADEAGASAPITANQTATPDSLAPPPAPAAPQVAAVSGGPVGGPIGTIGTNVAQGAPPVTQPDAQRAPASSDPAKK